MSRRPLLPVFCVLLAVLATSWMACAGPRTSKPATKSPPGKAKPWKKFTPPDKSFTVMFPQAPTTTERDLGGGRQVHLVEAHSGAENYALMYMDRSGAPSAAANARQVLDAGVQAFLTQSKGTLIRQKDVTISGFAGRELEVKTEPIISIVRIYIVGPRIYQITGTYPIKKGKPDNARRFQASFQITKAGAR